MNGAPDATIVPAVSSPTGTLTSNGIQLTEWSRIYLSDSCGPLPSSYSAWTLLGRTVSFTVDLSAAGCGCNIAFYLVSMRTNAQEGTCSGGNSGAYYCDANSVCGVRCDELDLMEANSRAFHSVAHHLNDGSGQGNGFGGNHMPAMPRYGPGGSVIDTNSPFRVSTTFSGSSSSFDSWTTLLEQAGRTVSWSVGSSGYLASVSQSVISGMTPVISYWKAPNGGLDWLDSPPCNTGQPSCGAVTLTNFEISPGF